MLGFVTPPEVSNNFMVPPESRARDQANAFGHHEGFILDGGGVAQGHAHTVCAQGVLTLFGVEGEADGGVLAAE